MYSLEYEWEMREIRRLLKKQETDNLEDDIIAKLDDLTRGKNDKRYTVPKKRFRTYDGNQ